MTTNTPGHQARQQPRQVVNTLRFDVNYDDEGIAAGVKVGTLPPGAFITDILAKIVTGFDAGTTNVLTVGTNASSYDNIIASADVTEGTPATTRVTTGLGVGTDGPTALDIYAKYTQSGTVAQNGRAIIVICFEGNTN